jgi:hypothetical protein
MAVPEDDEPATFEQIQPAESLRRRMEDHDRKTWPLRLLFAMLAGAVLLAVCILCFLLLLVGLSQ